MDMQPFQRINPCGYAGLAMTQLCDHVGIVPTMFEVGQRLEPLLLQELGYARDPVGRTTGLR
jgi:lipoyl(octanoyl) transferase